MKGKKVPSLKRSIAIGLSTGKTRFDLNSPVAMGRKKKSSKINSILRGPGDYFILQSFLSSDTIDPPAETGCLGDTDIRIPDSGDAITGWIIARYLCVGISML